MGSALVKSCGRSGDDLTKLISNFLPDYGKKHGIKIEDMLAEYALTTMATDFGTWQVNIFIVLRRFVLLFESTTKS